MQDYLLSCPSARPHGMAHALGSSPGRRCPDWLCPPNDHPCHAARAPRWRAWMWVICSEVLSISRLLAATSSWRTLMTNTDRHHRTLLLTPEVWCCVWYFCQELENLTKTAFSLKTYRQWKFWNHNSSTILYHHRSSFHWVTASYSSGPLFRQSQKIRVSMIRFRIWVTRVWLRVRHWTIGIVGLWSGHESFQCHGDLLWRLLTYLLNHTLTYRHASLSLD